MRVLIVITSDQRRGAELEGAQLTSELGSAGLVANVVALAPASKPSRIDVALLGKRPLGWSTLRALRRRAKGVDVVIAYGSTTLPACALATLGQSTPFVYRSIGDPTAWIRGPIHRWRTRMLMRRSAHVVALWPEAANSIRSLYAIAADKVSVIPNARSSDEFRPRTDTERLAARTSLGLPLDATIVGCVGSISAEKRLHLAVDAIAELPEVHLLIVGDGPHRTEVEQYARDALGNRSTFTGILDDVIPVYRAIDTLLLTSSTEGMPGVVLEAAMSGVPVVATDVGAMHHLFDAGVVNVLVPLDGDSTSVAASIEAALARPPRPDPLPADHLRWPAVVDAWIELLRREVEATASHETGTPS